MTDLQLVWFRNDLRTRDHVALCEAALVGPVVAVYCFCPDQFEAHDVGGNRVAFTLAHLEALSGGLAELGIALRIVEVPDFEAVPEALAVLADELGARQLWFNEEYPINERRRDDAVARRFAQADFAVTRCTDSVVAAPGTVLTGSGGPYTVFTPFRRRWTSLFDRAAAQPRARPARQAPLPVVADPVPALPSSFTVTADLDAWAVGEDAALARLEAFVGDRVLRYEKDRDHPALDGTSALSPYLSLGVISVRTCLDAALAANEGRLDSGEEGIVTWISELVWREFYRHVVAAFPHVSRGHAFRREYDDFPWRDDAAGLAAW
ncbi:MAG: deoxyribodipyrimidine photo-lyase, partial [Pseudomonadales bacterium]|nr:deoxyribodipyrimidine photo-lyase [Pseudomonadales bacterium]